MIVLDACALVDLVIDQPWRDQLLAHLDQPILAPAHQPAEVLSALARLRRSGQIGDDQAEAALVEAAALDQTLVALDGRLLQRALALDGRVRVLDGLYVALAEERRCALLTSDARLAGAGPPCDVVLVPET
ncbi:MAG TPA: type II toxin-antitoxin system VapC family toxin [Acidimicrobiales bacterium]|nr:type II toxin-antitoxin system VapC family toxin [Acidimicrobiales bacterium]